MDSSRTTIWTIMAAVGGLLAGVAAVLALFMAKPETISVFVPVETLRAAVAAGDAGNAAANNEAGAAPVPDGPNEPAAAADTFAGSDAATTMAPPAAASPQPNAMATQQLPYGVTLSLISLANSEDRYTATFRVDNGGAADVGTALFYYGSGLGSTNIHISDGVGGSCQMDARGGTNFPSFNPQYEGSTSDFQMLQPGGRAQYTGVFLKRDCERRLAQNIEATMTGSFVAFSAGEHRTVSVTFDNITMLRLQ